MSRPLLDRLEIIRLYSYTELEKIHIAKNHLIPENLEKYNLNPQIITFSDTAISDIIKYYTRESGVRELNRKIQIIIRKFILEMVEKEKKNLTITPKNLTAYLKKRDYEFTAKQKKVQKGVATGLA